MQVSIKLILAATLLITASTSGYTAQEQEATGETIRRTFKFTTHSEETRAQDWSDQIVTFCKPVLRDESVNAALKTMGITLFTHYSELSLQRQDNIAGNVPRAYSALEKIDNVLGQIEYINALHQRHVTAFEKDRGETTGMQ